MIKKFHNYMPDIHENSWIADNADVIGRVTLQQDASVFFQSVVRGDSDSIFIDEGTNIQDSCILHTDPGHQLIIGKRCTIGHGCILHGCHIEDEVLIGMGAIIMDGAHIRKHTIVGAGAVVTEHKEFPERSILVGNPARVLKTVSDEQVQMIKDNAQHYIKLSKQYKEEYHE